MKQELFFVGRDGELLQASIFEPLLNVLFPAFLANAAEVQMSHSEMQPGQVTAVYQKNGERFPLAVEPGFQWPDIFVRVKILAGLSIMPESHQKGQISVLFKNQRIPISVETTENDQGETLDLKVKPKN